MSRAQQSPEIKTEDTPELEVVEALMPARERQAELDREYIQFLETRIHNLELLLAPSQKSKKTSDESCHRELQANTPCAAGPSTTKE